MFLQKDESVGEGSYSKIKVKKSGDYKIKEKVNCYCSTCDNQYVKYSIDNVRATPSGQRKKDTCWSCAAARKKIKNIEKLGINVVLFGVDEDSEFIGTVRQVEAIFLDLKCQNNCERTIRKTYLFVRDMLKSQSESIEVICDFCKKLNEKNKEINEAENTSEYIKATKVLGDAVTYFGEGNGTSSPGPFYAVDIDKVIPSNSYTVISGASYYSSIKFDGYKYDGIFRYEKLKENLLSPGNILLSRKGLEKLINQEAKDRKVIKESSEDANKNHVEILDISYGCHGKKELFCSINVAWLDMGHRTIREWKIINWNRYIIHMGELFMDATVKHIFGDISDWKSEDRDYFYKLNERLDIDYYSPSLNIGFEYQGHQAHVSDSDTMKRDDKKKELMGDRLIVINKIQHLTINDMVNAIYIEIEKSGFLELVMPRNNVSIEMIEKLSNDINNNLFVTRHLEINNRLKERNKGNRLVTSPMEIYRCGDIEYLCGVCFSVHKMTVRNIYRDGYEASNDCRWINERMKGMDLFLKSLSLKQKENIKQPYVEEVIGNYIDNGYKSKNYCERCNKTYSFKVTSVLFERLENIVNGRASSFCGRCKYIGSNYLLKTS